MHCAGPEDVDDAVAAAARASKPWRNTRPAERARLLHKLADLAEAHVDEIAALETKAMGAPLWIAKHSVMAMAGWFRYYAGWADKLSGETILDAAEGVCKMVAYEPLGVCAGIAAWNGTLLFVGWKIGPAVAAGNTYVHKVNTGTSTAWDFANCYIQCSEKSPLSVLALGKLIVEAGFPPGVINLLSGEGDAGQALAAHMDVAKISFTGSSAVGRKVQVAATNSNLKRCTLELGGKSAALVFDDADMENALAAMSMGFLVNSTQVCAATTRLLVQESAAASFVAELKTRFEQVVLGDPDAPDTFMGPLVDKLQFDRVNGFIESGRTQPGVEVVTGGSRFSGTAAGFFVTPTILLNPPLASSVWREEIFGPVLCVRTFTTEDEAIALANDSNYGLAASVFTSDMSRALRVAAALEAGSVNVNQGNMPDTQVPFGGWKESGTGREGGKPGIMAYVESKSITIKMV